MNPTSDIQPRTDVEPAAATAAADVKAEEPKPEDAKPVDAKPVDAKPVDAKPVDAKPVDAKPVDAKPVDAKPVEPKPTAEVKLKPVWVENEDAKPAGEAKAKPVWAEKTDAKPKQPVAPTPPKPPSEPKPKPGFDANSTLASPKPTKTGPPPPDDTPDLAVLVRDSTRKPDDLAVLVNRDDPKRAVAAPPRPPRPPRPTPVAPDVVPVVPPPLPSVLSPVDLASLVPDHSESAVAIEVPPPPDSWQRSATRWFSDRLVHAALVIGGVTCTFEETTERSYARRRPTWPPLTNLHGMADDNYRIVSEYVGAIETETRTRYERVEAKLRALFATTAIVFVLASGFAITKHPVFVVVAAPLLVAVVLSLRALGVHRFVTPALSHQEAFASRTELRATVLTDRLKAANASASAIDFMVDCFRVAGRFLGVGLIAMPLALALGAHFFAQPDDVRVHVQSIEPAAASALGAVPRPPITAEPAAPDAGALPLAAVDAGPPKDAGAKLAETDAGAVPAAAPSASAAPPPTAEQPPPVVTNTEPPKPPPAPKPSAAPSAEEPAPSAAPTEEKAPLWERP